MKLSDYGVVPTGGLCENVESIRNETPEVRRKERELKSDVWSLGVALIYLGEQRDPFMGYSWEYDKGWICDGDPPSLSSEKWSAECVDFVGKCLVEDVKERWSVKQLMEVSDWGDDLRHSIRL